MVRYVWWSTDISLVIIYMERTVSLYSWIKRHNLERGCCNKPYNWKIAIRWYFTTRKSFFLSKLAYWRPFIFTDWLVNQNQHFSFSKCSRDLFFFLIHWQIYEQAIRHQKHCSDRNPKRRKGGGGEMIILDLFKSIWFWQMQDISKHVLFTNSKFNRLRCYFSLSGYSFILLVYTFNFHLLHIKYYTVFSSTSSFSTLPLLPLKQ